MATPKTPITPLSPTVAAVFEEFLAKIDKDDTLEKEVSNRLRDVLLKKRLFDVDSIRLAVFDIDL